MLTIDSFGRYQGISDLTLDCNSHTGKGLYLNTPNYGYSRNLRIINNAGTGNANAALYIEQATCHKFYNLILSGNVKSLYSNSTPCLRFYGLDIDGSGGTYNDSEFYLCSDLQISGMSLTDDIGFLLSYCANVGINGVYIECPMQVPAITIGQAAKPARGIAIRDIHVRKGEATTSLTEIIQIYSGHDDDNIVIDGYHFIGGDGTHQTYHIVLLGGAKGVTLRNIGARDTSADITSLSIIRAVPGATHCIIDGVYVEAGVGDTPEIAGKFMNCDIRNTNVHLNLLSGSHDVLISNATDGIEIVNEAAAVNIQLINVSGTITDAGRKSVRIDNSFITVKKDVASAAELALGTGKIFYVTGTTNITSIAAVDSISGREITLIFQGILTFTDGNNLVIAGNFVTTGEDVISLACYNGNWYERSRSAN